VTCRPSEIHWRDALYNAVRQMPGGVNVAATYLTDRRGRAITGESLRKKLRGVEGESVSLEIAELLTEWMQELVEGRDHAVVWIQSLAAQFGVAADPVPASSASCPGGVEALQTKVLQVAACAGQLASVTAEALADGELSLAEGDAMVAVLRASRAESHRAERLVRQWLKRKRQES